MKTLFGMALLGLASCLSVAWFGGLTVSKSEPVVQQDEQQIDERDTFRKTPFLEDGWNRADSRRGIPDWQNRFKQDVFTFARIQYSDGFGRRGRWGRGGKWRTDYPDSDLNFSYRLQQLTSMKVAPDPVVVRLTDKELFDYPFVYLIEPGLLEFREEEVIALRRYLDNGGFMMVDDFWGEYEFDNFYSEMKRVFPDREPVELEVDHPVFSCVYELKEKPQVPSLHAFERYGVAWERVGSEQANYYGYFDKDERMSVIVCHNTDLGDGWEREGQSRDYFEKFSEPLAYPMGINIVIYAMTH